jgi:predicted NAD/FAD-dependent oxidoreductase
VTIAGDEPGRAARQERRVAVVGAGISGLAAACTLRDNDFAVRVFERGRGVGGRTAREPRFARVVQDWTRRGLVAAWTGRILALDSTAAPVTPTVRHVGVPGMHAMAKHMARDLDVTTRFPVVAIEPDAGAWYLHAGTGPAVGPFDAIVLAMPPEQAARVSKPSGLPERAAGVKLLPCWYAMAAFEAPLPVDFDGAFVDGSALDWIARDSSKPGRPARERWVIHASAQWPRPRLGEPRDETARALLDRCFEALGLTPREPECLLGHRWSYTRPCGETGSDCAWLPEHAVALCGDWCRGGRVEGAFLSGVAATERIAGV